MKADQKNYLNYVLGFIFCLLVRMIPLRAPNIEPILAVQMPFSRIYGSFLGFSFGFFSIVVYDFLTSGFGIWTLITAIAYGLLGLWAVKYFQKQQNKKNNSWTYVKFALMSTLFYDIITGLTLGPLFFHQSFVVALTGQIPFTMLHLLGNSIFAYMLSPGIYNLFKKKKTEITSLNVLATSKI